MSEEIIRIGSRSYGKTFDEYWNRIMKLEQENKQLKQQLDYLRNNEYLNQVKWERTFNEELVKDLQQKIDKAIEKIYKIIESNNSALSNPEYTIVNKHKLLELNNNDCKELLEILGEKE